MFGFESAYAAHSKYLDIQKRQGIATNFSFWSNFLINAIFWLVVNFLLTLTICIVLTNHLIPNTSTLPVNIGRDKALNCIGGGQTIKR